MTDTDSMELDILRNFYLCWKEFHCVSGSKDDNLLREKISSLVEASHAVETVQKPRIITLNS